MMICVLWLLPTLNVFFFSLSAHKEGDNHINDHVKMTTVDYRNIVSHVSDEKIDESEIPPLI